MRHGRGEGRREWLKAGKGRTQATSASCDTPSQEKKKRHWLETYILLLCKPTTKGKCVGVNKEEWESAKRGAKLWGVNHTPNRASCPSQIAEVLQPHCPFMSVPKPKNKLSEQQGSSSRSPTSQNQSPGIWHAAGHMHCCLPKQKCVCSTSSMQACKAQGSGGKPALPCRQSVFSLFSSFSSSPK